MASSLNPIDFILQTFDAFSDKLARNPDKIFDQLGNYRKADLGSKHFLVQPAQAGFATAMTESRSAQQTMSSFAAAAGIEGRYQFYSGSVLALCSREEEQAGSAYHFGFHAEIKRGTACFATPGDVSAIRACLRQELLEELDSIKCSRQAKQFSDRFGTHVILGVKLGGTLYVKVRAQASSPQNRAAMSAAIHAQYREVSDLAAIAAASNAISQQFQPERLVVSAKTIGGDNSIVNSSTPNDAGRYRKWANSCGENSVSGLWQTKELWELAPPGSEAQLVLKQYVQLRVLIQSLHYPSHFAESIEPKRHEENTVTVMVPDGYKVISGGFETNLGGSNFPTGSRPAFSSGTGAKTVVGWTASSHDRSYPSRAGDVLAAYAIAVYDPEDLLTVSHTCVTGHNPGWGADNATARLPRDVTVTGGGLELDWRGGNNKYLMQSYPDEAANGWTGYARDYLHRAEHVPMTVHVLGISCKQLVLSAQITSRTICDAQRGNETVRVKRAIAGGGVRVDMLSGEGNFAQQGFPSSFSAWTESNTDADGRVSRANATVYAIQLEAKFRN